MGSRVELSSPELIETEAGIQFSAVEHEDNVRRSDEKVKRAVKVYEELLGRPFTDKDGLTRPLTLEDFLFIAPYNVQVRALKDVLPASAKVVSVDWF